MKWPPRSARAVVFLPSGEAFCVSAEPAWSEAGGRWRVRVVANAVALTGPAELPDGEATTGARVPVGVDVTLEPLSMPVTTDDPHSPDSATTAQGVRMAGTLAVGSVIHRLRGQGWVSRSGFSGPATEAGVRVQAAFQDGSGLLATAASEQRGSAALLVHTRTSVRPVEALRVAGAGRGPATGLDCVLGGRAPVAVRGQVRHPDQHVAFVRPSGAGDGWVRLGVTPLDVVRSGVTGFGLVEHVTRVATADAPRVTGDDEPDPF